MPETGYRIRIKQGDSEIEVQGDKEFVLEKYNELATSILAGKSKSTPKSTNSGEIISLVEFLKEKNPKSHPDISIVFAYYLHKNKGLDSYNVDDMEKCYADTRTPKSMNTNEMMGKNVEKGFLMPADSLKSGKKAWVITRRGVEYVEAGLKKNA